MDEPSPLEALQKKHRLEQRDLQARITSKKKNATKKTRKGVNDECAALEQSLQEKHSTELAALDSPTTDHAEESPEHAPVEQQHNTKSSETAGDNIDSLENSTAGLTVNDEQQPKKQNRQKARLARRAVEQQAAIAKAEEEAADVPDHRTEEREVMNREITARGLVEREVRSDGHCLYAAIADQIQARNIELSGQGNKDYKAVRHDAARYIQEHPEDFEAFLEEPLETYVTKIRDTGEWGGQLELSALAKGYGITVNVLQGDGRVEKIVPGEEDAAFEVWLAYYRHSFGLGEHYNSLRAKPA